MAADGRVVHAYGVVDADALESTDGSALSTVGLDEAPLRAVPLSGLAVVVGDLAADRFGEDAWREHGEDPRWLEPVARRHHEVLQAVADQVDVLPLRLPGIYPDDDMLLQLLGREHDTLQRRLAFVSGHDEWGVQVFVRGGPADTAEQQPTSGREYLLRRRAAAADRDQARQQRQDLLLEVHRALAEHATSSVLNRPQDRALSGRDTPMVLNSAHLVARHGRDQFFASVDELTRRRLEPAGLCLEVSGPWPPYNFATEPAEADPAARSDTADEARS